MSLSILESTLSTHIVQEFIQFISSWAVWSATMGSSLGTMLAVDMGIQWSLWAVAAYFRTEKFFDLAGSSTFGILLAMSYPRAHASIRQKVQTAMVATWAVRLGVFLFTRVMKQGSDSRFTKTKNSPGQFLLYWTVQGTSDNLYKERHCMSQFISASNKSPSLLLYY